MLEELSKSSLHSVLLSFLCVLVAVHFWKWINFWIIPRWSGTSHPPGPFPWPLIGNAMQIGNSPHMSFAAFAKKYGGIFQIKLGSQKVVVLNGDSVIRQALLHKGADFAGRPAFPSFQFVSGGRSLAFGDYNERWKAHRKLAHSTVRHFSTGNPQTKRSLEHHIMNEARELIILFSGLGEGGKYFSPGRHVVVAVANVMSAVCFGQRYNHGDKEFQDLLSNNDKFSKTVGAGSFVDVMPWLQYFPNPVRTVFNNFQQINKEFYDFVYSKFLQHRNSVAWGVTRDMMDAFIHIVLGKDENNANTQEESKQKYKVKRGQHSVHLLETEHVPASVTDIFGASQDTLSTGLLWIIFFLIRYPEVQSNMQDEVDKVIGRDRLPCLEDQAKLPYIMAFLHESMRFSSFVPITIPHATTKYTNLMGYNIPKGTVVFVNQWSVNHDPQKWTDPQEFNPSRFLDENGFLDKDLVSNVMIFSVGKRRCIGEELAKIQLFLFTSVLVHQCIFTANPTDNLNQEYDYGLSIKPKPFMVNMTLRRRNMDVLNTAVLSMKT
ncbi:cytochrome P450 1B1 [Rhinophrynus dorsalis]